MERSIDLVVLWSNGVVQVFTADGTCALTQHDLLNRLKKNMVTPAQVSAREAISHVNPVTRYEYWVSGVDPIAVTMEQWVALAKLQNVW